MSIQTIGNPIEILLVKDNPGDVRLMQEALDDGKVRNNIHVVKDGVEALAFLHREGKYADVPRLNLVLLDLNLPRRNDSWGLETFTRMHARAPEAPVVVLTGLDDATLAIKAVQEGVQDYLIKSQVNGNLLTRTLHFAIERKRAEEEQGGPRSSRWQ